MLNVGDLVKLNKDDVAMNWIDDAEVIHTPRGERDVWGFRDRATGAEVYTNEKFTAYVKERAPQQPTGECQHEWAEGYGVPAYCKNCGGKQPTGEEG